MMNEYLNSDDYLRAEQRAEQAAEQAAGAEFLALEHHLDRLRARLAVCAGNAHTRIEAGPYLGGYPEVLVLLAGFPLEALYGGGEFEVLPPEPWQRELPF